jgi:hypothetical protein
MSVSNTVTEQLPIELVSALDILYNFSRMIDISFIAIYNTFDIRFDSKYNNTYAILYLYNYSQLYSELADKILNYLIDNKYDISSELFTYLTPEQWWIYTNRRKYLQCVVCYKYRKSTIYKCRCKFTTTCVKCSKQYGGCPTCRNKYDKHLISTINIEYNINNYISLRDLYHLYTITSGMAGTQYSN